MDIAMPALGPANIKRESGCEPARRHDARSIRESIAARCRTRPPPLAGYSPPSASAVSLVARRAILVESEPPATPGRPRRLLACCRLPLMVMLLVLDFTISQQGK